MKAFNRETLAFLELVEKSDQPSVDTLSVSEARTQYLNGCIRAGFASVPVGEVQDIALPLDGRTLRGRLYTPSDLHAAAPLVIYFHGGGFVIGDLDTHDSICRKICHDAGVIVASIDYRRAPEHPFPAAVHDALDSVDYLLEKVTEFKADPNNVFVAGDSAGGSLAATVAQAEENRSTSRLQGQILIYPVLDHVNTYASRSECSDVFPIPLKVMEWFDRHYFANPSEKSSLSASPGLQQNLENTAPALVITAEFDPLRDEAEHYGHRLSSEAKGSLVRRYSGTIHGFLGLGRFMSSAQLVIDDIVSFIDSIADNQ